MTLKLVFTAFLLDTQLSGTVWRTNRQVSLLVVLLRKALSAIPLYGEVDRRPTTPKRACTRL